MKLRLGELFCGAGGIGLGAKKAVFSSHGVGIRHVWATDYDTDSCGTYRRNICPDTPGHVITRDIRKLSFRILKNISGIDILAFGFPCNDFSVVGEQKGEDGVYGSLYEFGIKALRFFKPMFFLAENVAGLKNSNDGKTFTKILHELSASGYVLHPHLYKFEEYGIPQARHRVIVTGVRADAGVDFGIPSSAPYIDSNTSCRYAVENPPIPPDAPNNELTRQSSTVVERLKHIKPGENAFTADIPRHLRLNVKGAKISQIYKRLDPDKPAYTVTGSGGGGTHVYHWSEHRALTNRERARLQTFPDDFVFSGSKESVRKQIGMAVPPAGAHILFDAILKSYAGIRYPHTASNISSTSGKKEKRC